MIWNGAKSPKGARYGKKPYMEKPKPYIEYGMIWYLHYYLLKRHCAVSTVTLYFTIIL